MKIETYEITAGGKEPSITFYNKRSDSYHFDIKKLCSEKSTYLYYIPGSI